jgi:hypothetical protein
MIPGTGDRSSEWVRMVASGLAGIATRRGQGTRTPSAACPAAPWPTGRAVTAHVPGLTPRTSAVTATGPLPGRISSKVSSREKVSPGRDGPVTFVRRPVNLTVAVVGSPCSPGSIQQVTVSSCSRARAAHGGTSSWAGPGSGVTVAAVG